MDPVAKQMLASLAVFIIVMMYLSYKDNCYIAARKLGLFVKFICFEFADVMFGSFFKLLDFIDRPHEDILDS